MLANWWYQYRVVDGSFLAWKFQSKIKIFFENFEIFFLKNMFNKINQKWCFMNDQGENLKKKFETLSK